MYHAGELEVQRRLGVASEAARIGNSIRRELPDAARRFVEEGHFVALARRGSDGVPTLRIGYGRDVLGVAGASAVQVDFARTVGADPDPQLRDGDMVGMVVVDFATRRRMRLNGRLAVPEHGLPIVVADAVFSNCSKYIQQREQRERWDGGRDVRSTPVVSESLTSDAAALIGRADTFFIASSHPDAGADANHRGGAPGFVEVLDRTHVRWTDYPGNRIYQTLGNIVVDDRIGLAIVDFASGAVCFVRGRAGIEFIAQGEYEGIRFITVTVDRVSIVANAGLPRYEFISASPHNPELNVPPIAARAFREMRPRLL